MGRETAGRRGPARKLDRAAQLHVTLPESLDSPPAAPGRVAAKPPRPPNRPESAASGKILRTGAKKPALRGRQTAPRKQTGPSEPPESAGRADGGPIAIPAAIPARCPVTNRAAWCVRSDCRHWSDGCSHPEAARPKRKARRR